MRHISFTVITALALSACSIPKSRNEMLGSFPPHITVCSQNHSPREAVERLQQAWSTCFVRPPRMGIAQTGKFAVAYEQSRIRLELSKENSTDVLVARLAESIGMPTPLSNSILLMADIQATSQCRSEISVRAATSHWEKRSRQTEIWLNDPTAMPAEAACN